MLDEKNCTRAVAPVQTLHCPTVLSAKQLSGQTSTSCNQSLLTFHDRHREDW